MLTGLLGAIMTLPRSKHNGHATHNITLAAGEGAKTIYLRLGECVAACQWRADHLIGAGKPRWTNQRPRDICAALDRYSICRK